MCSIGGFVSSHPLEPHEARKLCTALLWYGADRGIQSSGCYINKQLYKAAMEPSKFIDTARFIDMFDEPATMALTHTRQPTSGGLGNKQAQPFVQASTATVHNGWIINIKECKRRWGLTKPSGVDSELFTSFLATRGPGKFADFVEFAEGTTAIAAIHDDKMYLIRHGNPTFFCRLIFGDNHVVTVFASSSEAVQNAMTHTWLMPDKFFIQGTQQNVLLEVTGHKMRPVSRKIRPTVCSIGWAGREYGAYGSEDPRILDDDMFVRRLLNR